MEDQNKFSENETEVNNEQLIDRVISMLRNPKQLIGEARKVGGKGIGRVILVIFLFVLVNFICLISGMIKLFSITTASSTGYLLLVLIVGIAMTAWASSKAYNFALIDAFGKLYPKLTPLMQKICTVIIHQSEKSLRNSGDAKQGLDFGKIIDSAFKNIPRFAKKIFVYLLSKTPIPNLVMGVKEDILEGKKEEAAVKLKTNIDAYLNEFVFEPNNTNWVYWLLPLNIVIQYLVISYGMK